MKLDMSKWDALSGMPRHVQSMRWVLFAVAVACLVAMSAPSWLGLPARLPSPIALLVLPVMLLVLQAATPVNAPTYGTTYLPLLVFVIAFGYLGFSTINERAKREQERVAMIAQVSHFCATTECAALAMPGGVPIYRCLGISYGACEGLVREGERAHRF